MASYRSLLLAHLPLRCGGIQARRLELHAHLPDFQFVDLHRHGHWQILVYLSGSGVETIGRVRRNVSPGSAVLLPPGTFHGFQRQGRRAPSVLSIDFAWKGGKVGARVFSLSRQQQAGVQALLERLRGSSRTKHLAPALGAEILGLMGVLLEEAGALKPVRRTTQSEPVKRWLQLAARPEAEVLSTADLARRTGRHPDYLNRKLKRETGFTLGQSRARIRLERAKSQLRRDQSIARAGKESGFADPNYFSRWFRKQTGQTPSVFRRLAANEPD